MNGMPLPPEPQDVILRDSQEEHLRNVLNILGRFPYYIDGSEMGTGKTVIAIAVALIYNLSIAVVAPLSAKSTWREHCLRYGVPVHFIEGFGEAIMSYETLRSKKDYQPKHNLLFRDDTGNKPTFYATQVFSDIVSDGVLLVFDECQKLKNTSDQHMAAKALIQQFYRIPSRSRIGFLSGTVIDKPEHTVNLMRLLGMIEQPKLYSKINGEVYLEGLRDLHHWASIIDYDRFQGFTQHNSFNGDRKKAPEYVLKLVTSVIKPSIISIMPSLKLDLSVKNAFFKLRDDDREEYEAAIGRLAKAARYDPNTQTVSRSSDSLGAINLALIDIQKAKAPGMVRLAKKWLEEDPNCKVLLYVNYYDVIDYIKGELAGYFPLELTGRVKEQYRTAVVAKFQEPNLDCRLLVGNPLVGGLAVSLHDTTGMFPRKMAIMQTFRINESHQTTRRISRAGQVGKAIVRFFYGISIKQEVSILNALARKGEVMKAIHREQDILFPNEYPNEYENEEGLMEERPDHQITVQ